MYVAKDAALLLWVALTIFFVVIVAVVAVIVKLVRNKVTDQPKAKSWPVVAAISFGLLAVLAFLVR